MCAFQAPTPIGLDHQLIYVLIWRNRVNDELSNRIWATDQTNATAKAHSNLEQGWYPLNSSSCASRPY